MEGHARIETSDYIGDNPATGPMLNEMAGADGKPVTCDNVWISYLTGVHKEPDKEGRFRIFISLITLNLIGML
tara:strand:- start:17 stop:235 length:219 start_codon:yes stop_codon:yes gene_type:complete